MFVSKLGKGVGYFVESVEENIFVILFEGYQVVYVDSLVDSDSVYLSFIKEISNLLVQLLVDIGQVEIGFVLFVYYEYLVI